MERLNYYKLLSKQYPNIDEVSKEIINLSAILSLPKGTEHFLTDLHGEYEAFSHVVRNASGTVKRKIEETFGDTIPVEDQEILASIVYYPKEKLIFLNKHGLVNEKWYRTTIYHLILLLRNAGYKYTRSKVRKSLPENFSYIIEELVQEKEVLESKKNYYKEIIKSVIRTERADDLIIALADVIRRLVVDKLHIVGDIYDRGPGAHLIMDDILKQNNVDVQWGNHDIIWMGAAAGSTTCIANVLRICLRYANLETVQDGYGINLLPLAQLAANTYRNDPVECFQPRVKDGHSFKERDIDLMAKMQKAISVIQFKIEGQIIKRQPDFKMDDRLLLDKMSKDRTKVTIDGKEYDMKDSYFPTIDYDDPYKLTDEENEVMELLQLNFMHSNKLQKHVKYLYSKGSVYLALNDNLLYHGCIPFTQDGKFDSLELNGKVYSGKSLCDLLDEKLRAAYFNRGEKNNTFNMDMIWYAWCGEDSPLFGKSKMATFERYFVKEKETHSEDQNNYYMFRDNEDKCRMILEEFGVDTDKGRIINGHVPVKTKKGENPVKANGKMFVIDGGFSRAYQKTTGIAGYTLIFNSQAMILVSHEPFEDHRVTIKKNEDMVPQEVYVKKEPKRLLVEDTDKGKNMIETINILNELLEAYRKGFIEQKFK
jgi:fructose-1,6-bisphosphatase-3